MLNAKEIKELERLKAKAKEMPKPLTERELEAFEERIASVYDRAPEMLKAVNAAWGQFTEQLSMLANDNARLVAEVRRLTMDNTKKQEI